MNKESLTVQMIWAADNCKNIPDSDWQAQLLRDGSAEIERLRAELEGLKRGEFICRKCGLRKDGAPAHAEF